VLPDGMKKKISLFSESILIFFPIETVTPSINGKKASENTAIFILMRGLVVIKTL